MAYLCFKCSKPVDLGTNAKAAIRDECPACHADLHCCRNCAHYDLAAYNSCRESQAERVVDKERYNHCDYFRYRDGSAGASAKSDALKKLDDLFK